MTEGSCQTPGRILLRLVLVISQRTELAGDPSDLGRSCSSRASAPASFKHLKRLQKNPQKTNKQTNKRNDTEQTGVTADIMYVGFVGNMAMNTSSWLVCWPPQTIFALPRSKES